MRKVDNADIKNRYANAGELKIWDPACIYPPKHFDYIEVAEQNTDFPVSEFMDFIGIEGLAPRKPRGTVLKPTMLTYDKFYFVIVPLPCSPTYKYVYDIATKVATDKWHERRLRMLYKMRMSTLLDNHKLNMLADYYCFLMGDYGWGCVAWDTDLAAQFEERDYKTLQAVINKARRSKNKKGKLYRRVRPRGQWAPNSLYDERDRQTVQPRWEI
jgi:hypothetical protein